MMKPFEKFSIAHQVPTPLPLLSENDYKHLVQNALKVKANPAVKITIKEVAGKENVPPPAPEPVPAAPTTPRGQGAAAAVPKGEKKQGIDFYIQPAIVLLSFHRLRESLTFYQEILQKTKTFCSCAVDGV